MKRRRVCGAVAGFLVALWAQGAALGDEIPPSWVVLPVPRFADYGAEDSFAPLSNVAVVRRPGSLYQTVRTPQGELQPGSTVIEEELVALLEEQGVAPRVVDDTAEACEGFDTLILLGPPGLNAQAAAWFDRLGLSFDRWKDTRTPGETFPDWASLGPEGYVLKTEARDGKTIVMLAGGDPDGGNTATRGAGTFYALQSFRQLLVRDGGAVKVKTAEILDKPLLAVRGCYSGFDPDERQEQRNIAFMARIKANQNVYWYGNNLAGYNSEAASRFRYPWKPDQLEVFRRIGRYCREHFITMVFCMNPDHFTVDWAAPKSFDGARKDPLHYNLDHPVEPEFQEMWKELGFEVHNDVDILAAKLRQLRDAVPGALLQIMNEDDVFGLVHEEDKRLFETETADPVRNAENYGKARGQLLAALYARVKALCPDYAGPLTICPPGSTCYQFALERDEQHAQAFLRSLASTLKDSGLLNAMPLITTGGGTAAEVVAGKQIDDFRRWSGGAPVVLHDNNFPQGFHIGAYETDKAGRRFPWQANPDYPAGYRDAGLYKQLAGIHWNGINDQHVLGWCQAQFMWNMPALERDRLNALAVRKVCSAEAYPAVKTFYGEFDNAACYLPDNQPPLHVLVLSDNLAFRGEGQNGWQYAIAYTDDRRREAQRLRDQWARLKPELVERWDSPFEKAASMKYLGDRAHAFCAVYLAYGYLRGWEGRTAEAWLDGPALRDLYLEADDIQERFFAGPDDVPGETFVDRGTYTSALHFLYTDGKMEASPEHPSKAARYVSIWDEGLRDKFYTSAGTVVPAAAADESLAGGWDPPQEADGERFRTVSSGGSVRFATSLSGPLLIRAKLGSATGSRTDGTAVTLEAGGSERRATLGGTRWITWSVAGPGPIEGVNFRSDKPVRVYAVEAYRSNEP